MAIKKELLLEWFLIDPQQGNLDDELILHLPISCEVIFCNGYITKIIKDFCTMLKKKYTTIDLCNQIWFSFFTMTMSQWLHHNTFFFKGRLNNHTAQHCK